MMNRRTDTAEVIPDTSEQVARKQVTVLFCDVADYTLRSTTMDPEELADEIRVFQALCTNVADKYHGNISNFLGDGILVLFGHPNASEFDAEHAIRAGLEMVDEIEQNNASFEWRNRNPISIRVGIATSLVVVGEKAGKKRNQDELIFGEAPNLAARLQSIAESNTVVTSLRTRRLVGSAFKFKDLGEHQFKGFAQPIPAWQLLHESRFQNRNYISLKRVTTKFVSRDRELEFLTHCYELAINGQPTTIHLIGEAGIGKSRLLRFFEKTLKKQQIHRIRVSCSPYYDSTPLRSVINEICRWLEISLDEDETTIRSRIHWALSVMEILNNENFALFCELFSVGLPEDFEPSNISAEEKHQRIIRFLADMLFTLSKRLPILLMVEDLHWSDPTTMELLSHIIKEADSHRIFTILTSRPDFKSRWEQSGSFMNLYLSGLSPKESARLVETIFDNTPLPAEAVNTLVRKSDGVPLFLEECSWHILSHIREHGETDRFHHDFIIPDTLQDSLNARLDLLDEGKELAQLAATFGDYFTYSKIKKIAAQNGIDADNSMDILLQADLLTTILDKDEDRYVFRHALIRDTAYQSLLIKTRQRYHQQIAELYISDHPDIINSEPELIAYHYSHTEHIDVAIDLWLKAGKIAITKSAVNEAADHLNRGLRLISSLAEDDSRRRRELDLLLNLAVCFTVRSGYFGDHVTRTYQRCIKLANKAGNTEQQWSALYGFWRCLICQAEFNKAMGVSVKLKRLSDALNDRKLFMTSSGIQAMTRMYAGKFSAAQSYYNKSVKLYNRIEDKNIGIRFGQDPYVTIQGLGAINRLIRNDPEQSKVEIEKSVEVARSIGHPYTIAETLRVAAMYEQISRDIGELYRFSEEAIEISEKFEFEGLLAASKIFMAFSNVVTHRDSRNIETIRGNLKLYKDKYALMLYPYFQGLLAESYLYMHRFQEAFTESSHVLLLIQKYGEMWAKVPIMHIRAEAAARGRLADRQEIIQWYGQAESLAISQNAELFLHRVRLSRSNYVNHHAADASAASISNDIAAADGDSANLSAGEYITRRA